MQVFNAITQQDEDVVWSADANNEVLCTFEDGHFLKFPEGTSLAEIKKLVAAHEAANVGQEVITPEVLAAQEAVQAANEALLAQLNGGA